MRKGPDFIGIGAQKSGTTWLYSMLNQHPKIFFPKKEINFFNDRVSFYRGIYNKNYQKGIKWYLKLLNQQAHSKEDKIGDISPDYMFDRKTPRRIYKHFPNTKIIVILRDPVERAYSQYLFASSKYYVGRNFETAIQKNPEFLERSLYYKQLKRYFELFPQENIKIIFFEEIKKKPKKMLNEVCNFIGVPKYNFRDINKKQNPTKYLKSNKTLYLINLFRKTKLGSFIYRKRAFIPIRKIVGKIIKQTNKKEEGEKPILKQKTKEKLKPCFREDVKKIEKIKGKKPFENNY